jgi:hypothetical protein
MSEIIKYIDNELFKFNLNFTVKDFNGTLKDFDNETSRPDQSIYTFTKNGNNYIYSVKGSFIKGTIDYSNTQWEGEFEFVKELTSGSYNKVSLYKFKGKDYILREASSDPKSKLDSITQQFFSFYENLKHLILYILIKKEIGNVKLIPIPYLIGLYDGGGPNIKSIMIMEKGAGTLSDYFEHLINKEQRDEYALNSKLVPIYPKSIAQIKIYLLNIYHYLYLIDTILKINFKHNDLKCNNIVVSDSRTYAPLIIDFGYSEFIINGIRYDNNQRHIEDEKQIVKNSKGLEFDYLETKENPYNIVHDFIQLISSLYFIQVLDYERTYLTGSDKYKLIEFDDFFTFVDNIGSNIMDSKNLKNYLKFIYIKFIEKNQGVTKKEINPEDFPKLYKLFYDHISSDIHDYISLHPKVSDSDEFKMTVNINPYKLAHNLGLKFHIFEFEYEQKYLKYKMKYMKLKNKI